MKPFLAIFLPLLLMLGACTAGKTILPENTMGFSSPRAALAAVEPVSDINTIYKVTAKVTHTSPQGKMIFRLAVMIQSPDKLRLESIPVLGPPDFFLTAQGGRFRVYRPGTQEFITGNASPNNLYRFLPLAWSAERWIAVLLANHPETSSDTESTRGMMEEQLYRVDVLNGQSIEESLWINPKNKRLEKADFLSSDGLRTRIIYTWGLQHDSREIPANITINPGNDTSILITCTDLQTTVEPESDLFELSPPADEITIQQWD